MMKEIVKVIFFLKNPLYKFTIVSHWKTNIIYKNIYNGVQVIWDIAFDLILFFLPPDLKASNSKSWQIANDENGDDAAANLRQVEICGTSGGRGIFNSEFGSWDPGSLILGPIFFENPLIISLFDNHQHVWGGFSTLKICFLGSWVLDIIFIEIIFDNHQLCLIIISFAKQ